jgi:predicted PurR-regulated permease PerM
MTDFNNSKVIRTVASLIIAGALCYGMIILFQPFLLPLAMGGVIALLIRPLYTTLKKYLPSPALCAAVSMLIFVLLLIIPLGIVFSILVKEISNISYSLQNHLYSLDGLNQLVSTAEMKVGISNGTFNVSDYFTRGLDFIASRSTSLLGGVFGVAGSLLFSFISAFYILHNTDTIRDEVLEYSPMSPEDTHVILRRAKEVIYATVTGNLLLTSLQGVACSIWLVILGIGSPLALGLLFGLASMVPTVGSMLVWVPLMLYEISQGKLLTAVAVVVLSIVQLTIFDNFLGPKLIERKAHLHPFFVLLGVLGGVGQFGVLGIILGPTIVALGIVGIEILRRAWQAPLASHASDHQKHSSHPENID